jgi:hypothetical protein
LYLLRADRVATRGKETGAVAVGENTEEREFVGHVGKIGVKTVVAAEVFPYWPKVVAGGGIADTQAVAGLFLSKAECTAESIAGRAVTICQGRVCGYVRSK